MNVAYLTGRMAMLWPGKWSDEQLLSMGAALKNLTIEDAQVEGVVQAVYMKSRPMVATHQDIAERLREIANSENRRAGCSPPAERTGQQSWASIVRASHSKCENPIEGTDLEVLREYHRRIADKQRHVYGDVHPTAIVDAFRDFERACEHDAETDDEMYMIFGDEGVATAEASRKRRAKCVGVSRASKPRPAHTAAVMAAGGVV